MKILFLFLSIFSSTLAFAQFAIISDKDGSCHVRSAAEFGNNVADTLMNGHLVYCFEAAGNWVNIDYSIMNRDLNGYVYHDRLKMVSDFKQIPFLVQKGNSVTYVKDSVKVLVTTQKFVRSLYKLSYFKNNKDQILLINGKHYWGTDGEQPRTEYKSVTIAIGNKNLVLPKAAIENLFEPTLLNTEVSYDQRNDILYIQSSNSDGAGGYYVIWKIENGRYNTRYIAHGF